MIALEAIPKLGQPRGDGLLCQDVEGVSKPGTREMLLEDMLKSTVSWGARVAPDVSSPLVRKPGWAGPGVMLTFALSSSH